MATAIEYGIIAAGISVAIIAVVSGTGGNLSNPRWDDNYDKKQAAAACAARPAGNNNNVVITTGIGRFKEEYRCSDWPRFSYPTRVRSVF